MKGIEVYNLSSYEVSFNKSSIGSEMESYLKQLYYSSTHFPSKSCCKAFLTTIKIIIDNNLRKIQKFILIKSKFENRMFINKYETK